MLLPVQGMLQWGSKKEETVNFVLMARHNFGIFTVYVGALLLKVVATIIQSFNLPGTMNSLENQLPSCS